MFYLDKSVEWEGQTFHIRCMTGADQMRLFQGLELGEPIPVDRMLELLKACLIGWDEARNLRGDPMGDYDAGKIEWLDARAIDAIVAEVINFSSPSDEEKKTPSGSQSLTVTPLSSDAGIAGV